MHMNTALEGGMVAIGRERAVDGTMAWQNTAGKKIIQKTMGTGDERSRKENREL